MVLELHHMRLSQSDRILWMLEEMQLPYELIIYDRDPKTALSPQALKDMTPVGTAPYFRDTSVTPPVALYESGAIVQYLMETYGPTAKGTKLSRHPGDADYADYLTFFHYSAVSLQSSIGRVFTLGVSGAKGGPLYDRLFSKFATQLELIDAQLSKKKYLAGDEVSAADIMTVFPLTTMRGFSPYDLSPYPNILRYLKDVTSRPAFVETLKKGDNAMAPMIEANTRRFTQFEAMKPYLEKA